jgi:hypothetical protein
MYFEPRRIGEIFCVFKFPHSYSLEEKEFIEHAVKNSPVYLSLHPDIKKFSSSNIKINIRNPAISRIFL